MKNQATIYFEKLKTELKKNLFMFLLIMTGLTIATFQSCQKYPDGPFMSLHSRTERVSQSWKVDNYKKNGTDYTSLMSGYSETYTKDGNYSYSWSGISGTGKWAFQNSDKEIKLNGINNQASQTLFILKLEQKQFWYYYMDGNDKKEFHMIVN